MNINAKCEKEINGRVRVYQESLSPRKGKRGNTSYRNGSVRVKVLYSHFWV